MEYVRGMNNAAPHFLQRASPSSWHDLREQTYSAGKFPSWRDWSRIIDKAREAVEPCGIGGPQMLMLNHLLRSLPLLRDPRGTRGRNLNDSRIKERSCA